MSFAKFDLAPQGWELGKAVLSLASLGIFTKILHVDLSQFQLLGITFDNGSSALIPGFIGLALIYAYLAFLISRLEASLFHSTNKDTKETNNEITKNKGLLSIAFLALPFSIFVYSMPYFLGMFAIIFLWTDSATVLQMIWSAV